MRTEMSEVTAEAQIRGRIDDWLKALHDKDIDRVMAHYASGILVCDLAPPLRRIGSQALKQSLEEWFRTWEGPIGSRYATSSSRPAMTSPIVMG